MYRLFSAFIVFVSCFLLINLHAAISLGGEEDVVTELKRYFPNLTYESISESPVSGLYEIVTQDGQIFYWAKSGYFVFGEIWSKEGRSITQERRQQLMVKKLSDVDLSKAVKVGKGSIEIIAFEDPECPFCRKGFEYFSKQNVTEYVFLLPLHGESSQKKIAHVLCSQDKEKAYSEVMSGKFNGSVSGKCLSDAMSTIQYYTNTASMLGIRGTPTYYIKGSSGWHFVSGFNIQQIEALIQGN